MTAPGRARPNYTRRRLVALVIAVVVVWLVLRLLGAAWGAAFGGDGGEAGGSDAEVTSSSTDTTVALATAPPCVDGEVVTETAGYDDWQRTIVDTERRLPAGYEPPDLVSVEPTGFTGDFEVRSFVVDDLRALREAAEANGTPLALISAYRSAVFQEELFTERVSQIGEEATAAQLARPGHSEHQLGTTVDVGVPGSGTILDASGQEAQAQFLRERATEFGFVISYPAGTQAVTCYTYEPWHLRYVGRDLAQRIEASGLTLREYQWHWQQTGSEP